MATAYRLKELRGETVSKVGGAPSEWVPRTTRGYAETSQETQLVKPELC